MAISGGEFEILLLDLRLKFPIFLAWEVGDCPDEIFADWLAEKDFLNMMK